MSIGVTVQLLDDRGSDQGSAIHFLEQGGAAYKVDLPQWKRFFDVFIGAAALVLLSPLMLITVCLIRMTSPGPTLFRQTRVGHGGHPFQMLKFRTMLCSPSREEEDLAQREVYFLELVAGAQPDPETRLYRTEQDPRVTTIGKFLRIFSIDELPQLINVIRGEMSLVGPRPALQWEAQMLTGEQRRRHAIPPGMTGLWQVLGRNRISSLDMIKLDLEYVDHFSFWLDLSILIRTPWAVLFQRYTR